MRFLKRLFSKQESSEGELATMYESALQLENKGEYSQALTIATQVCEQARTQYGKNDPHYATSLLMLARLHQALGSYATALPLVQDAVEIRRKTSGENTLNYANSLDHLALLHREMGNHAAAEPISRKALDVYRMAVGENHPDYAIALDNLALSYIDTSRFEEAERLCLQASEILRDTKGEKDPDYATCLNNLAGAYLGRANYAAAEPMYQKAAHIRSEVLGQAHPDYGEVVFNLGYLYLAAGNWSAAESHLCQALPIIRGAHGGKHKLTLSLLQCLVKLYQETDRLDEAIKYCQELVDASRSKGNTSLRECLQNLDTLAALYDQASSYEKEVVCLKEAAEIVVQVWPEDKLSLAHVFDRLGHAYIALGEYLAALAPSRRSLEIKRRMLQPEDPDLAQSLLMLARACNETGEFAEAERILHEVIDSWQGEQNSLGFATALNNLAALYFERGDIHLAKPLLHKVLEIRHDIAAVSSEEIALWHNNLGFMYMEMGDFVLAKELLEEALMIAAKTCGEMSSTYAHCLYNLAELHMKNRDPISSAQLMLKVIEIRKAVLGEEHPDYAAILGGRGLQLLAFRQFEEAEKYLLEFNHLAQKLGEELPMFANSLYNLGLLYGFTQRYTDAIPKIQKALELRRKIGGDAHPATLEAVSTLAFLYAVVGKVDEVIGLLQMLVENSPSYLSKIFSITTDRQRLAYTSTLQINMERMLALVNHYCQESQAAKQLLFDLLLQRKAIVAEASLLQTLWLTSKHNPDMSSLHETLVAMRLKIKQLQSTSTIDPIAGQDQIELLTHECETLEEKLAGSIPIHDLRHHILTANQQTVVGQLPCGSVLIEIVSYKDWLFEQFLLGVSSPIERYAAFVITSTNPHTIHLIDLGETHGIDRLIADYRAAITGEARVDKDQSTTTSQQEGRNVTMRSNPDVLQRAATAASRHVGALLDEDSIRSGLNSGLKLREMIFDPLLSTLDGQKHLIVAPDGNLNLLPFQALPLSADEYVIDRYQVSYVSTGRDAMRFGTPRLEPPTPPLVIADPDYDLAGNTVLNYVPHQPFQRLAGIRREGEKIADLLTVHAIMNGYAVEDVVKKSHSPQILHIATHGLFLQNRMSRKSDTALSSFGTSFDINSRLPRNLILYSPLVRSALVFAGANAWLRQGQLPAEADDGFLTAEDVATMDLAGTDLVVLSACNTAVGDIQVGEGVFGLRRAFAISGARRLIMSLWKVPDDQTRELMVMMYENLIHKHLSCVEALQHAQLEMRKCYPDRPYYWGAFICQGDPSSFELVT